MKSVAIKILKFAISFAILAYLYYKARQDANFDEFAQSPKQWHWVAFGLAAGLSACLFGFYRWYILVRALDVPIGLADAIRLGFLGHLFNLMSVGVLGGDALKSVFVAKHVGEKKTEAILSIFADRFIGLVTMFSFAAIAFSLCDFSRFESTNPKHLEAILFCGKVVTIFSLLGVGTLLVFVLIPNFAESGFLKSLTRIKWVGGVFARFLKVISAYRKNPIPLFNGIGLSICINVLFACAIFGVAAGLSDAHPSFTQHFLIAPIAMVANAVPLPGGIGGMEFALDYLYRGFSDVALPTEHGFVVALGFRLVLLLVAMMGVFVYLSRRREIKSLQKEIESEISSHSAGEIETARTNGGAELTGTMDAAANHNQSDAAQDFPATPA